MQIFKHKKDGSLWVIESVKDGKVNVYPNGGGSVYSMPEETFFADTEPVEGNTLPWRKSQVGCDWLEDVEVQFECYLTDQRWNGWAMPCFTKEQAMKVMAHHPEQITYDADKNVFSVTENGATDDDGNPEISVYEAFWPQNLDIGEPVFDIGSGSWCWYELEEEK